MTNPDKDWLIKARRLDEDALGAVYDAFSDELYRYAYRLLGEQPAAEDLVAETFYRFLRALHAGGGPREHLRAYLYRVAHNLAIDGYRKGQEAVRRLEEASDAFRADDDPSSAAEEAIQGLEAREALWLLTPEQRQVIVLKYFQGLTNTEVGAVLEKSVGAIKALQHRGLNSLRRILGIQRTDGEAGS